MNRPTPWRPRALCTPTRPAHRVLVVRGLPARVGPVRGGVPEARVGPTGRACPRSTGSGASPAAVHEASAAPTYAPACLGRDVDNDALPIARLGREDAPVPQPLGAPVGPARDRPSGPPHAEPVPALVVDVQLRRHPGRPQRPVQRQALLRLRARARRRRSRGPGTSARSPSGSGWTRPACPTPAASGCSPDRPPPRSWAGSSPDPPHRSARTRASRTRSPSSPPDARRPRTP